MIDLEMAVQEIEQLPWLRASIITVMGGLAAPDHHALSRSRRK